MKLIELMLEANVEWPEGAEYAAQDKATNSICCYDTKPKREGLRWGDGDLYPAYLFKASSTCRNWHQTVVTREQYEAAQAERNKALPVTWGETNKTIEQKIKDMVFHQESIARYQEQIKVNQVIVDNLRSEITADLAALGWGEQPNGCAGVLEITDWRQLKVGDIIEPLSNWDEEPVLGHQHEVTMIDRNDLNHPILIDYNGGVWGRDFKFISRPSADK